MRYAKLKKLSERTSCTSKGVQREQILTIESCGSIQTLAGCVDVHPVHIGRKVRVIRDMAKKVIQDLTFVD